MKLINRDNYLIKIIDTPVIKITDGVRRLEKSILLDAFYNYLISK